MARLDGGRFLITGASSGIGLEVARRLVAAGGEVCLVGRRSGALSIAADELGRMAWTHPCDLSDPQQIAELAAVVAARWDRLEGLVNNAGYAPRGTLEATTLEEWERVFAVNARAPYLLIQALLPALRTATGASVVNVSSNLAGKPIPGMAAYTAAKGALNHLTRSTALELAPEVRINAVMPGVVDTPIHAQRNLTREQVEGMADLHPMGRIGVPGDVAALILFLLSDDASWITGAVVPVDGGAAVGQ